MELIERGVIERAVGATEFDTLQDAATCLQLVTECPTVDAVPVVRGRWVEYMPILGAGDKQVRCSECGLTPSAKTPYCPYCGVRMDGEEADL